MKLFDAHCHLQDDRLRPHLDASLARAEQVGVSVLMCCGSSESDWPEVDRLAGRFPQIKVSFGLHPWYVGERSADWLAALREYLTRLPSAVGEIGLDHAIDPASFADQETVFAAQLELAHELRRPVSVHCRRAWDRLPALLDAHGWPEAGVMFHSFSGSREMIASLTRHRAFFSYSGSVTHSRNVRGRNALAATPLDRLLIETDAPDIPPALPPDAFPLREPDGHPITEPAHLHEVLRTAAELKRLPEEAIASRIWQNASSLWP